MALPPGPPFPAAVQTLYFLLAPLTSHMRAAEKYGDLYTIKNSVFGTEVVIGDPELVKQVFTGDPDVFHAGEANTALGALVGRRSLLLLDGPEHLRQRRLMLPPFHGERMHAYAETMREVTEHILAGWRVGDRISLHPFMQRITLEIILRAVFGLADGPRRDELRDRLADVMDRVQSPFGLMIMLPILQRDLGPLTPWAGFRRELDRVHALLLEEIGQRRATPAGERGDDVLSLLIEAKGEDGAGLSDEDLRDELMTLLAAGHETTATALCWAFEQILAHPDVLARLEAALSGAETGGRLATDDIVHVDYLDATVKEVLRLRPPIPVVGRKLKRDVTLRGHRIPAGTVLVPSMYATQLRADIYPDPFDFRPERFLGKKADPYAFFPFGGGIRRCLGMAFALYEMKVVIASVLRRARLRLADKAPLKVVLRSFVFAPDGGTRVLIDALR